MKLFKTILLICSITLVINGCTTSSVKTSKIREKEIGGEIIHNRFTIKPSRSYEECIELRPGMVFDYDFDSSDFVNFNIHYHAPDGVHYPVAKKGVMIDKGMVDPGEHSYYTEEQEFYCLMWDNLNDEPVKISFTCVLRNK